MAKKAPITEAERYARLIVKLRRRLSAIVNGLEDEGDRVYFGSTNHADALRKLYRQMDDIDWDRIMAREK